jgi:hypothetical protein
MAATHSAPFRVLDDRKPGGAGLGIIDAEGRALAWVYSTPRAEDTARLFAASASQDAALRLVCEVLAMVRDGEEDRLPHGWAEDLKYQVVDRAIEAAEPAFDGGTTTPEEALRGVEAFRAAIAKANGDTPAPAAHASREAPDLPAIAASLREWADMDDHQHRAHDLRAMAAALEGAGPYPLPGVGGA